jgi:glucan phosphoethanolaminetransferase (alkaline phosphatase superfamily)
MSNNRNTLWYRWIIANALSELIGLGATFATIGLLISKIDTQQITGIVLSFALTVLSGAIEATLVGLAQWWALHPWFPLIGRFAWWRATLAGALLGYVLGYLPSTLMSMGNAATQTTQAEPPEWVTLLLAAGLGAVAGAVLSFAQWLVFRSKLKRAGLWIPANMLAWAFGMPVVFLGMDLAFKMTEAWQSVLVVGGALLIAGIIVGAIHGRFLVILAGEKSSRAA